MTKNDLDLWEIVRKRKFFPVMDLVSEILVPKMHDEMNLRIITKRYAAASGIRFLTNHDSNPKAWELITKSTE